MSLKKSWACGLLLINSVSVYAGIKHIHLDLETSYQEFRSLLNSEVENKTNNHNPDIEFAIKMGERLFKWIEAINEKRPPGEELRITSPETRRKFPIESPMISNPTNVAKATSRNLQTLWVSRTVSTNSMTLSLMPSSPTNLMWMTLCVLVGQR